MNEHWPDDRQAPTFRPSQITWAVSPPLGCYHPRHHRHLLVLLNTKTDAHFAVRTTEGRSLSRPRHCGPGAQPVPKTAYRSGRHDKHNRPR